MRCEGFLVRGVGMNATSQLFAEPCSLLLASFLSLFLIRLVFFRFSATVTSLSVRMFREASAAASTQGAGLKGRGGIVTHVTPGQASLWHRKIAASVQ